MYFVLIIKSIFPLHVTVLNMSSKRTFTRKSALELLGFLPDSTPTKAELKKAYRKAALEAHPDKGGSSEEFDALTKAYELLTTTEEHGSSDASDAKVDNASVDDLIAELLRQFGAENVTVTHTAPSKERVTCGTCGKQHLGACRNYVHTTHARATTGDRVTCGTCGKQHLGVCRNYVYTTNAHATKNRVTCGTCGKQHLGACRNYVHTTHARATTGDRVTCGTCGKQHLGACRYANTA